MPVRAAQWLDSTGTVLQVDIMRTDAQKARGLMYRLYLPPLHGMVFVFDPPQPVSFWMYHTYIPLAMAFYDARGRLIAHYPHAAPCYHAHPAHCLTYPADGAVKYVLETRPATHHIRPPYAPPEPAQQLLFLAP